MRLSEFSGKEIIGLDTGEKMGVIGHSDLEINTSTGEITAIILPGTTFFGFGKRKDDVVIPWNAIVKIGPDMIIVGTSKDGQYVSGK
ncbi:YlmC/YmxH family sporulation protein [Brevibacillus migulae]|uniref:YlmC/YmxH family sporulation protein n=1 Tax=Brevibacillus migulae TaxID=1644114 RepID=UPI00106E4639|nr:YlmC/YmxH family sporulation protein [Brevibacillus migulae]